ncbi:MAG TPA: energy-coupled thiamine transporter ThiT [Lachnospiraceae bacterium]|nr:energy-coupled thiamine transporter ThiT [Lachnospiraceae bacterium]
MLLGITNIFATGNSSDGYSLTTAGYILTVVAILAILTCIFLTKKKTKKIQTKQLVFAAVAMALSVVTSFIKFAHLPFGGSVTLFSMFFICFIGYLYGLKIGIITGIAYGFLQLIIDPSIYYPLQLVIDYPIAFGCLGLAGVFSRSKHGLLKGYILGVFFRYVSHVISGYVFFGKWAPEGRGALEYSITYNASYIVPEAIATVVILLIPAVLSAFGEVKRLANQA